MTFNTPNSNYFNEHPEAYNTSGGSFGAGSSSGNAASANLDPVGQSVLGDSKPNQNSPGVDYASLIPSAAQPASPASGSPTGNTSYATAGGSDLPPATPTIADSSVQYAATKPTGIINIEGLPTRNPALTNEFVLGGTGRKANQAKRTLIGGGA